LHYLQQTDRQTDTHTDTQTDRMVYIKTNLWSTSFSSYNKLYYRFRTSITDYISNLFSWIPHQHTPEIRLSVYAEE